jgi:hypothetical protein
MLVVVVGKKKRLVMVRGSVLGELFGLEQVMIIGRITLDEKQLV